MAAAGPHLDLRVIPPKLNGAVEAFVRFRPVQMPVGENRLPNPVPLEAQKRRRGV
jgi:hypothetical protein